VNGHVPYDTFFLFVVIPGRSKGVDHLTIREGNGRVGNIGRDNMDATRRKYSRFTSDGHLQLSFEYISYLLMEMMMLRQGAALFDIPNGQRTVVSMKQPAKESGSYLLHRYITEMLHFIFFQNYTFPHSQCG